MIFYFSGTGNSRWVAETLADKLYTNVYEASSTLDCSKTFVLEHDESVGFVFPVHAWGPPEFFLTFIKSLHFSCSPSFVFFVCTCGDDAGKTQNIFCRFLRRKGWNCVSGYSVIMPNTYVCLPGFDVDVPDVELKKRRNAEEDIDRLARSIKERREEFCCYEGHFPYLKTYILRPFFRRFLMSSSKFHVTESCISCGICEKSCPLQNIHLIKGKPQWGDSCTMCLSCYHHCPEHAIAYGRQTAKKGQYLFERHKI